MRPGLALCLTAMTASGLGCGWTAATTAGRSPSEATGPQDIAWGSTANELQAGLSVKQRRFEAGKTIEIAMHLRTTADKELHLFGFTKFPEWLDCHNAALTFTSRNPPKKMKAFLCYFHNPAGHMNLRRGEVLAAKWTLDPADKCWALMDEKGEAFRPLPPGTYEVTAEYAYSEKEKQGSLNFWKGTVTSGTLEVEVIGPVPVSPAQPPATTAERVARLQAEIDEIEAHCVPAKGTSQADVEKRFGPGKRQSGQKQGELPEDIGLRSYAFCDNGTLAVQYDEQWRVLWAHYWHPYMTSNPSLTTLSSKAWQERRLRELEPRLRQMKAIQKEYDRRFPEASRSSAPPPPPIRGTETAK